MIYATYYCISYAFFSLLVCPVLHLSRAGVMLYCYTLSAVSVSSYILFFLATELMGVFLCILNQGLARTISKSHVFPPRLPHYGNADTTL
jgi:hypothetical protein